MSRHKRLIGITFSVALAFVLNGNIALGAEYYPQEGNESDSDLGRQSGQYTDNVRDAAGMQQAKADKGKSVSDERGKIEDNLMDTVIYNDIADRRSHGMAMEHTQVNPKGNLNTIKLDTPAARLAEESLVIEKAHNEQIAKEEAERTKNALIKPSYFVGGYCSVNTPVKIVRNSEFTILNCTLDFGDGNYRDADIFAGVYPNYQKETLTMLPITASFSNQSKASMNGIVFAADKSSLNVSDHTETFKIRRLVAEYGLTINDVAYRYATDYVTQLQVSRTTTQVDYVTVPDPTNPLGGTVVPIVNQNTTPPKANDYFAMAGIELFSRIFSIGSKNLLEDTDPLFRIFKGKRVYVEGVVSFDNAGLSKKYGIIAEEEKKNITKDNDAQKQKDEELIKRYDKSTNTNMVMPVNRSQNYAPLPSTYPTIIGQ